MRRALAVGLVLAALCPLACGRGPVPLEDSMPHVEYARLFDAFHAWSTKAGRTYSSPDEKRAALTAYYHVRALAPRGGLCLPV